MARTSAGILNRRMFMSRLVDNNHPEEKTGKQKLNKRQRRQKIMAGVIAVILVGAMVFTLIPTFFM